jgi:hypothetical protein
MAPYIALKEKIQNVLLLVPVSRKPRISLAFHRGISLIVRERFVENIAEVKV